MKFATYRQGTYELLIYGSFTRRGRRQPKRLLEGHDIPVTVRPGKTVTLDIGRENSKRKADKEPKQPTSATPVKPEPTPRQRPEDRPRFRV